MQNFIYPQELFAPYPKYPLIKQHPSILDWETFEEETKEKKTVFTPLFQSFTPEENEALLNSYYGAENILEEIHKIKDGRSQFLEADYYLAYLTLQIQQEAKKIHIIHSETGELLLEIPLSEENLSKKLEDFYLGVPQPHFYSF